jgi:hypothetical protein
LTRGRRPTPTLAASSPRQHPTARPGLRRLVTPDTLVTVAAQPAMTGDEWAERMRHAAPPTPDDVSITLDGRRLDSRQAVLDWLADLAATRQQALEHERG